MSKEYQGIINNRPDARVPKEVRRAYNIWISQRARAKKKYGIKNGREYTAREFIYWWLSELSKRSWCWPTCGRIDHTRGYTLDNIRMEEMSDNVKERNSRLGNPGRSHRKILCITREFVIVCTSKREASKLFKVSEKTIYNHCQNRTETAWAYGPNQRGNTVRFSWAT